MELYNKFFTLTAALALVSSTTLARAGDENPVGNWLAGASTIVGGTGIVTGVIFGGITKFTHDLGRDEMANREGVYRMAALEAAHYLDSGVEGPILKALWKANPDLPRDEVVDQVLAEVEARE